jgi:hypothetical protein
MRNSETMHVSGRRPAESEHFMYRRGKRIDQHETVHQVIISTHFTTDLYVWYIWMVIQYSSFSLSLLFPFPVFPPTIWGLLTNVMIRSGYITLNPVIINTGCWITFIIITYFEFSPFLGHAAKLPLFLFLTWVHRRYRIDAELERFGRWLDM